MARILFVNIPAEGHINPTLGLVKQLVDNGEEVVYLCTEEYRSKIEQTGAQFVAYPFSFDSSFDPAERKHPYEFPNMVLRGLVRQIVPEVLTIAKASEYDYVIYDSLMCWGGSILSDKLGIPVVSSITSFAFTDPLTDIQTDDFPSNDEAYAQQLYDGIVELAYQLSQQFDVPTPTLSDITAQYGTMKLVYTSRYFQPQVDRLDDSYIFTGSSIVPRHDAPPFPFEQLQAHDQPIVYISMGTILNRDLKFYELCFAALRDVPVQVVLSSGKYTDMEPLADCIPDNFTIAPYVPQLEMLQRADAFVTHAGMNSTSEAMYYSVPLVMIPLTSDQPAVAHRVQELGAGISLNSKELTPEMLRDAVLQVLNDPAYKEQAHVIGESLKHAGGYKNAADALLSCFAKA
ncbi:macrolide family glycosyltransferase [Paenibacillus sp. 481]|uniref:macrolide family glycosyltransferase n=1 Tax=Paenibacillus sp. 481 TaxID=2835869 RepID=UPI001E3EE232|nr:macrolide family glycosyltransferase [Paenibacillus sp. 481]UHA73794.1 glycosyl transferase [Paenibacillus sp. 481]